MTVDGTPLRWHAVDTTNYNVNLFQFAAGRKRPTSNVLFWVVTLVRASREVADARLASGRTPPRSGGSMVTEAVSLFNDRQTVIDDGVSKSGDVQEGRQRRPRGDHQRRWRDRLLRAVPRCQCAPITALTIDLAACNPMTTVRGLRWWMIGLLMSGRSSTTSRAARSPSPRRPAEGSAITTQQYSWILGAFQGAIMLQPICGYVLDVLGLKIGFAIFAIAWSFISMAHGLAHSWQALAGLRGCSASPKARPIRPA